MESKKKNKEIYLMILIGGLIGLGLFLATLGYRILDVTYDGWLREYDITDKTLAYKGWLFFRNSKWHWPLGLFDDMTYPAKTSLIYTDSVPIVALICKLFRWLLPETFQYIGIYTLLCFILQGGLSALIFYKLTGNKLVTAAGTVLLTCSSVLLIKVIVQTGVSSNWLILAAYAVYVFKEQLGYIKKLILNLLLIFLAVSVNMYYVPMVLGIFFFMQVSECCQKKKLKTTFKEGSIILLDVIAGLGTLYMWGGFDGKMAASTKGLGVSSANVNALFNSFGMTGWSFSPTFPVNPGQMSGFAYIGCSGILLIVMAIILVIKNRSRVWEGMKRRKVDILAVFFMFLTFFVFALSFKVYLGSRLLVEYPLPEPVKKLFGVFRTTGRFMYPVFYGIIIIAIVVIFKLWKTRNVYIFLAICAVLHLVEFSKMIDSLHDTYFNKYWDGGSIYMNNDAFWEDVAIGKEELIFMPAHDRNNQAPATNAGKGRSEEMVYWAYAHGMRTNDTYLARYNTDSVQKYREEQWQKIYGGEADSNVLYVFYETVPTKCVQDKLLNIYYVDGYYIGVKEEIDAKRYEGVSKIEELAGINILPPLGQSIPNAEYLAEGLRIHPGGVFEGMNLPLKAGKYQVEIVGEGLKKEEVSCRDRGAFSVDIDITEADSERIVYTFELDVDGNYMEFMYNNEHEEDVVIKEILLTAF